MTLPLIPLRSLRLSYWMIWAFVALAMVLVGAAYFPGVMRPDAISQYEQAITSRYSDWHPPVMAWWWARIDMLGPGPASMLYFHLLLYGLGVGLIADGLRSSGRADAAVLVLLVSLAPIPLGYLGVIMKDSTLAVTLLAASGVVARFALCGRRIPAWAGLLAAVLIAFAVLLRFNAAFAAMECPIFPR
jgi:hypothetical protein